MLYHRVALPSSNATVINLRLSVAGRKPQMSHLSHSSFLTPKTCPYPKTSNTSIPNCQFAPNSAMWGRVVQANACKQVHKKDLCTVAVAVTKLKPQVWAGTSIIIPVVPRKAVAEVSKIGNL